MEEIETPTQDNVKSRTIFLGMALKSASCVHKKTKLKWSSASVLLVGRYTVALCTILDSRCLNKLEQNSFSDFFTISLCFLVHE